MKIGPYSMITAASVAKRLRLDPQRAAAILHDLRNTIGASGAEVDTTIRRAARLMGGQLSAMRGDVYLDDTYRDIVLLYVDVGDFKSSSVLFEPGIYSFLIDSPAAWLRKNRFRYRIGARR